MNKPKIICLCGSTRFYKQYADINLKETLDGNIVLSVGCFVKSDEELFSGYSEEYKKDIKSKLDVLHLHKIDLADEIFVINTNKYIGESTRREIEYAESKGKKIRYLEE